MPRGRLIFFTFSSQKHREQFLNKLSADGDNVTCFDMIPLVCKTQLYIRDLLHGQSEYQTTKQTGTKALKICSLQFIL